MPLVEQTRAAVVAVKTVAILTNAAENHCPILISGKQWADADADSLTVSQPNSAVWVESSSVSTLQRPFRMLRRVYRIGPISTPANLGQTAQRSWGAGRHAGHTKRKTRHFGRVNHLENSQSQVAAENYPTRIASNKRPAQGSSRFPLRQREKP